MDRSIPAGAARLLDFIYRTDAGSPPPACYVTIFGNRQSHLSKPLTSMTLGAVIDAQKNWASKAWVKANWNISGAASSAAGAAQFMRDTLLGLVKEMSLSRTQVFDAGFQDRLAYQLLKRRGYQEFMAGAISRTEFAKRLAMEWASFPVLSACKGATRRLKRGQSYYAGDGLNKALVPPEKVEAVLDTVKAASDGKAPAPVEQPATPATAPAAAPATTDAALTPAVDKDTIERVQKQLKDLGYTEVGGIDGKVGTMTATAIRAFRAENGLPEGDGIDDDLLLSLQKVKPREISPERANAPADVVRDKVPEVKTNWLIKVGAFFTTIVASIGSFFDGVVGKLGDATGYIQPVKDAVGDVPGWVLLLAIACVAGGLFMVARHGEAKGVEAFKTGARR